MIISRYLLRQLLQTLFAVTLTLLLLFVSQQLVRYLGIAASGKLSPRVLVQVTAWQIPFLLALMLPPGLYFSILLTYGKLYSDNELRVLHACGFSMARLAGATLAFAAVVAVIVAILTFCVNPGIADDRQKALLRGMGNNITDTLLPGRFRVDHGGRRVIFVEKISRQHKRAANVLVASRGEGEEGWVVLSAARGYQQKAPGGNSFLVAEDGYRYEGMPGKRNFRIFHFGRHGVRLPAVPPPVRIIEAVPSGQLWASRHQPPQAAELHWRLAIPLSCLLLAALAIPASQVTPRRSRYLMLLPAVLVYVIYMNLLLAARHMAEQNMLSPPGLAFWGVHLLLLLLVLLYWRRRSHQ